MSDNVNRSRFIGLPGFQEVEAGLDARGKPSYWIFDVVNTEDKHAFFAKHGRPWYRSECPFYEGYWLLGGCGSVQCSKCKTILPGLQWDITCSKDYTNCLILNDEPWPQSEYHMSTGVGCHKDKKKTP